MSKVFISHATKDRPFVEKEIINLLRTNGLETFYCKDDIDIGDDWERTLFNALESCDWFLLAMSPNSAESENVRDEVGWAIQHRGQARKIVPVLIADCDPCSFHIRMPRFQFVNFMANLPEGKKRLIERLTATGTASLPAPKPPPPAHVIIPCPSCKKSLKMGKGLLGKSVKCPSCAALFTATTQPTPAAPPPVASVMPAPVTPAPVNPVVSVARVAPAPAAPAAPVVPPVSVPIACDSCRKPLRIPEKLLGRKVKCPQCATVFLARKPRDRAIDPEIALLCLCVLNGTREAIPVLAERMQALGNDAAELVRKRKRLDREAKLLILLHALPTVIKDELTCTFAERALPVWETTFPSIPLPRKALARRRGWLKGEISDEELQAELNEISEFFYHYLYDKDEWANVDHAALAAFNAWGLSFDDGPVCELTCCGVGAAAVASSARSAMSDELPVPKAIWTAECDWQLAEVRKALPDAGAVVKLAATVRSEVRDLLLTNL